MHNILKRQSSDIIIKRLKNFPAVAILGPRQCGKSTLAKNIIGHFKNSIYLDLESPADLNKLRDPETFFDANREKLVCLDEIQRAPEIFPVLRSIIDRANRNGQLLILGSASRDLIRQSSETLAGRISYYELTPFLYSEVNVNSSDVLRRVWLRGGYPRSYLSASDEDSLQWRNDFIRTYLERDIPQLGFSIPSSVTGRLWTMCAHSQGQIANYSKLGESMGTSHNTVHSYINLLSQTFLLRVLQPYHANLKKRLVKSPKIFIRDSGLLHALLGISSFNDLLGHPVFGFSWEGFVIETILSEFPDWQGGFYRTSSGSEIDLILTKGRDTIAVECKASSAPEITQGFWNALNDLQIKQAWIIAQVSEPYSIRKNVMVSSLHHFIRSKRGN